MAHYNKTLSSSRFHPYSFNTFSKSKKSSMVSKLHKYASDLSNQKPKLLYKQLLFHSRIGKKLFPNLQYNLNTKKILDNIKTLHTNADLKHKSSILSLVADLFSNSELKNLGFNFSNKQFKTAIKKAKNKQFLLNNYQRFIPKSKVSIDKETQKLIINLLLQNSRLSSATISQNSISSDLIKEIPNFNSKAIYYLEKTKYDIYYELKAQNPDLKLSLSKFYKLCPKNFKKAKKLTDMCKVCVEGKKAKKKLQQLINNNNSNNDNIIEQLKQEINYYEQHIYFRKQQQQLYKKSIEYTTSSSCVIVIDFKENFKIGGGPVETGNVFYEKKQISLLSFTVIYKENDKQTIKYFNFFLKILNHNSLFVKDCINKLLAYSFIL
jgi:hypothetical protein